MKSLFLLLLCAVLVGCGKTSQPVVYPHCDLDINGVCYDHTDGHGKIVPLTKEEQEVVTKALNSNWRNQ